MVRGGARLCGPGGGLRGRRGLRRHRLSGTCGIALLFQRLHPVLQVDDRGIPPGEFFLQQPDGGRVAGLGVGEPGLKREQSHSQRHAGPEQARPSQGGDVCHEDYLVAFVSAAPESRRRLPRGSWAGQAHRDAAP